MTQKEKARDFRKKDKARFGGMKEYIWARDGYVCTECGMTQEQHLQLWGKRLTINHINGVGRLSKVPDNRIENLETLCLRCHGRKDGPRGKQFQKKPSSV